MHSRREIGKKGSPFVQALCYYHTSATNFCSFRPASRILLKYANALGEFSKTGLWKASVQKRIRFLLLLESLLRR